MEGRGQRELGEQGVLGEQGGLGEQGEQLGLGEVLHKVVEVIEEATELGECGGAGGWQVQLGERHPSLLLCDSLP